MSPRFPVLLILFALAGRGLADEIVLKKGDVLHGRILERNEDRLVFRHPDLGRIQIPMAGVASVLTYEDKKPQVPVSADPERKRETDWKLGVALGGGFTNDDDGEDLDLTLRVKAERHKPKRDSTLDLSYIFSIQNEEVDDNALSVISTEKWLKLESPWFYHLRGRYDYDEFRSWEQRLTLHGGAGYRLLDTESKRLSLLIGAGGRKDIGSEEEALEAEGLLGFAYRWVPNKTQSVNLESNWYPAIGGNDNRVITRIDWRRSIDRRARLSLTTHLEWEWDTSPDPGFPENTIRWTWGIQWDF